MQPGAGKMESDHPQIVTKAAEITAGKKNDLDKIKAIYDFVVDHIQYDLNAPVHNKGLWLLLQSGTGCVKNMLLCLQPWPGRQGFPPDR